MTTKESLQKIIDTLQDAIDDAEKHDAGQHAGGTRLRKAALDAGNAYKDLRKQVSNERNARD